MKNITFIFALLIHSFVFCQTGAVEITWINSISDAPLTIEFEIVKDSLFIACQESNEKGRVKISTIPVGEALLVINDSLGMKIDERRIYIQENQVVHYKIVYTQSFENNYRPITNSTLSKNGQALEISYLNRTTTNLSVQSEVQEIQACSIVAYRTPLIDRDGGATGQTLTREDIARMPSRTVQGIASPVSGVSRNEINGNLNIRSARSESTVYYIDGIRVRNSTAIPKAAIEKVVVITGGIPANYGDVTGGVISVETKSTRSYRRPSAHRTPIQEVTRTANHEIPKETIKNHFDFDRFPQIYENDFLSSVVHPNSTFSIDVDRASWSYIKQRFENNLPIIRDAVKMEEMINSFSYETVEVPKDELMHVKLNRMKCPWNDSTELISIHLKAKDLPTDIKRKPHNFVFLIDVSGSMQSRNKLGLLKRGLRDFVRTLQENDRVAIVTYAGASGLVLPSTLCSNKDKILTALANLESGGSTNGIGGIKQAYSVAEKNYNPELNNRIILCTDGDFNVGINSTGELESYISKKRGKGIYLTALGFGMGNYRNDVLETLADRGDGNHFYINNILESKRVLISEIGNLLNIARDVKLNVEFNPNHVESYRLIGYENRLLKPKDFEDDTKDAGEIGYGHEVTAVYEIILGKSSKEASRYTKTKIRNGNDELVFVKLRYKPFEDSSSIERKYTLNSDQEYTEATLLKLVVSTGLMLRDSMFKGTMSNEKLIQMLNGFTPKDDDEKMLVRMIREGSGSL